MYMAINITFLLGILFCSVCKEYVTMGYLIKI
jgi:hypothetical protein